MPNIVTDSDIIRVYFGNSHGIRGTAGILSVPVTRVALVIITYKKKYGIR